MFHDDLKLAITQAVMAKNRRSLSDRVLYPAFRRAAVTEALGTPRNLAVSPFIILGLGRPLAPLSQPSQEVEL